MATQYFDPAEFAPEEAEGIIDSLRYGLPAPTHIRELTVGREEDLTNLAGSLSSPSEDLGAALLVKANYGAGKSHLLRLIEVMALEEGYATSLVVVNAQQGVRFNRMDTILGAIAQNIKVPGSMETGIRSLFKAFTHAPSSVLPEHVQTMRGRISEDDRWSNSEILKSSGLYVALRAWVNDMTGDARDMVEDWLQNPYNYRVKKKDLFRQLVGGMRQEFRDPRPEWMFYSEEVFLFNTGGHRQAWDAVSDFDLISRAAGLKGLILLFDEFEDVIQNINRRDLEEQAFRNLFRFFGGNRYPGMSYFAVTPDFISKCTKELMKKGALDFDYEQFDFLDSIEIAAVNEDDFLELAFKFREVHGMAYDWDAVEGFPDRELVPLVQTIFAVKIQDLVREAIQKVVEALDLRLEGV